MADKSLFDLTADGKWRLAYDGQQWVIQKRQRKDGAKPATYAGTYFIGGWKADLFRRFEIMEKLQGVQILPRAKLQVAAFYDLFLDWLAAYDPDQFRKSKHKPRSAPPQDRKKRHLQPRKPLAGVKVPGEPFQAPSPMPLHP